MEWYDEDDDRMVQEWIEEMDNEQALEAEEQHLRDGSLLIYAVDHAMSDHCGVHIHFKGRDGVGVFWIFSPDHIQIAGFPAHFDGRRWLLDDIMPMPEDMAALRKAIADAQDDYEAQQHRGQPC